MSNTPPVFAQHDFRKASASKPGLNCVRVARRDGWVELRDDKRVFASHDDFRLVFTSEQFDAFQLGVRAGQTEGHCLEMTHRHGAWVFRSAVPVPSGGDSPELSFTDVEVAAFVDGINHGEFDLSDMAVPA